ncbi:MAG: hypothetical protein H6Q00_2026 [Holophagaceae bacterium]|nr:hypothetical protein [Holophagaceae bacterium]
MNRDAAYQELVRRRKVHQFPEGLLNPSQICGGRYDTDHLSPWSRWQGDLNAEVVVVGQDWGDESYFLQNHGRDNDWEPTCSNLRDMAGRAGWDLGTPHFPKPQKLFLTNAVLGIRATTGKSGTPPVSWVNDSLPFLVELLQIIQPRVVVSLGVAASKACRMALLGVRRVPGVPLGATMAHLHGLGPIYSHGKPVWFPFYHCGPLGLANRGLELQRRDWKGLADWMQAFR